jgi:PAS domain S-box-containing protein
MLDIGVHIGRRFWQASAGSEQQPEQSRIRIGTHGCTGSPDMFSHPFIRDQGHIQPSELSSGLRPRSGHELVSHLLKATVVPSRPKIDQRVTKRCLPVAYAHWAEFVRRVAQRLPSHRGDNGVRYRETLARTDRRDPVRPVTHPRAIVTSGRQRGIDPPCFRISFVGMHGRARRRSSRSDHPFTPRWVIETASDTIFGYARLFDAPGQAVIATSVDGAILYWNPVAAHLYGWQEQEVLGANILDVTPAAEMRGDAERIMTLLRKGSGWSGEFTVRRKNGTQVVVNVRDLPVRNSMGEMIGMVGVSAPTAESSIRVVPVG